MEYISCGSGPDGIEPGALCFIFFDKNRKFKNGLYLGYTAVLYASYNRDQQQPWKRTVPSIITKDKLCVMFTYTPTLLHFPHW